MINVAGLAGSRMASGSESSSDPLRSKRNAVVLLRWPLVIAAAYVMMFSGSGRPSLTVAAIAVALVASNALIARLSEELVAHAGFDVILLLVDTIGLSAGLYLTEAVSSDFYLLYFFVIFIAGVSERLTSVLMGSVLASAAYLSITLAGFTAPPVVLTPGSIALRVFFIFSVALFYGYLVERIRLDRERRQAEYVGQLETVNSRLRELVELRQAFLDSVSHELRSPLNALLGYIDLVRDGTVGEVKGPAQAYIHRAYNRGVHLMRLIEEVLNFSDISKGRTAVRLSEFDVGDMVRQIEASTRPVAEAKGLALQFDVPADVGSSQIAISSPRYCCTSSTTPSSLPRTAKFMSALHSVTRLSAADGEARSWSARSATPAQVCRPRSRSLSSRTFVSSTARRPAPTVAWVWGCRSVAAWCSSCAARSVWKARWGRGRRSLSDYRSGTSRPLCKPMATRSTRRWL